MVRDQTNLSTSWRSWWPEVCWHCCVRHTRTINTCPATFSLTWPHRHLLLHLLTYLLTSGVNTDSCNIAAVAATTTSGQRILTKGRIVLLSPLVAANGFVQPWPCLIHATTWVSPPPFKQHLDRFSRCCRARPYAEIANVSPLARMDSSDIYLCIYMLRLTQLRKPPWRHVDVFTYTAQQRFLMRFSGADNPQKSPLPLGDLHPI